MGGSLSPSSGQGWQDPCGRSPGDGVAGSWQSVCPSVSLSRADLTQAGWQEEQRHLQAWKAVLLSAEQSAITGELSGSWTHRAGALFRVCPSAESWSAKCIYELGTAGLNC